MPSKWSAEVALTWLAVASMEGAWLTLVYIGLQWMTQQTTLPLNVLHFSLAVALGMVAALMSRDLRQTRFAAVIAIAAVFTALAGAVLAGISAPDPGGFVRALVLSPQTWVLGLAVVRGAVQADPRSGYATEQLFSVAVPALVLYWILATVSGLVHDVSYTAAAFAATLTFVAAGLLAMGLSRLDDLEVEAVDRRARRRWLFLLLAIIGLVLAIGVPLAPLLGVPVSTAVVGVLGPVAPILIAIFSILSIPIFFVLDVLFRLIGDPFAVVPSTAVPSATGGGPPPPIFEPGTNAPPDLTWLLIVALIVGFVILVRILAVLLRRAAIKPALAGVDEVRASERIVLPSLPHFTPPRLRRRRRLAPRTASEAYRQALAAIAGGPLGRRPEETPREHAGRVAHAEIGRDIAWLATDYQLDEFGERRLTARESSRALQRWRRIVRATKRR